MAEEWKAVTGKFDGYPYEVSSEGRVRRAAPGVVTFPGRVLNPYPDRQGRLKTKLTCGCGSQKDAYVHQLVAAAFLGKCPKGCEVNHLNGDYTDNRPENMEYCSHARNAAHAAENGLMPRGERHVSAKLTEAEVREIRERVERGEKQVALAKEYGVGAPVLNQIVHGTRWQHLGEPVEVGWDHRFKLTAEQVVEVRNRTAAGETHEALAEEFGVTRSTIGDIESRKSWAEVGGAPARSRRKLTEKQVRQIRRRLAKGEKQTNIARAFGISQGMVSIINRRTQWKHVRVK